MSAFSATCQWIPCQGVVVFQLCPWHWPIWLHLRWLPANHLPVTVMVMAMWLRLIKLDFVSPNSFFTLWAFGHKSPPVIFMAGGDLFTVCWCQVMVSATGFEPVTQWLKVTCSTNWATRPYWSELKYIKRQVTFGVCKSPVPVLPKAWIAVNPFLPYD